MSVTLRDYQKECLDTILARYKQGVRKQLVCLPTGTGKTVVFASFPDFFRMKKKMLVLAHREELLDQAKEKIARANPELAVEVEQAGRTADPGCDVVVASVPTLGRKGSGRLGRFDPDEFYLIVVDEAHHAVASTYRRIFERLGLMEKETKKLLVGFTATPKRGDGAGLDKVFDEITFSRSLPEMIAGGYLAPLTGYRVETDIDLRQVKKRMGDYIASHLSRAVNVGERNDLVVDIYKKYLTGRKTLCFCVDVAHTHSLADAFSKAGISVRPVTGEMDRAERKKVLRDFSGGRVTVLTNCMVLTEGYDEASVEGIILARPTRSSLLYTQMIGRATRLHQEKDKATVIDIVDVTREHELVTLPVLFGFSDGFDLAGKTTDEVEKALQWVADNRPWVRTDLALSLDDLRYRCRKIDLYELSLPPELGSCARFSWTTIGKNSYGLNLTKGQSITIAATILGKWEVILRSRGKDTIMTATDTVRQAIAYAEHHVTEHRPDILRLVDLRGKWRTHPATKKQLSIISEKGIEIPENLTKGQASHIISMLSIKKQKNQKA
ncbi:MAG: DEAD/DEAH box helicase [Spirochaetales bacterium]|nr:DEAD/DEAH box helicase [Spirochaetales bacterium]